MSEGGDLFTSFYNQFVLRDILSMVFPGLTVLLIYWISIKEPIKHFFWIFADSDLNFLPLLFVIALSYVISILFIGLSDWAGCFRTYYTKDPENYQKRTKDIIEKLSTYPYRACGNKMLQIRERYVIFTQSCGNFGWACFFSAVIFCLSDNNNKFWFALFFIVLSATSWIGYDQFKTRQVGWDKQFLNDDYEKWSGLWFIIFLSRYLKKLI